MSSRRNAHQSFVHELQLLVWNYWSELLIYLFPMNVFSTPWKYQKTLVFSDVFRRWRKSALGTNALREKSFRNLKIIYTNKLTEYFVEKQFAGQIASVGCVINICIAMVYNHTYREYQKGLLLQNVYCFIVAVY